jgi:DMSO reductase family type II enzyme heme b subunit
VEQKCGDCHGAAGRGDGPAAANLKDDEGHPSISTDLTQRWRFKLGSAATDVFRTLASGLNGTPMKSYPGMSGDDRWALAHYVDRIGRGRPRAAATIQAAVVSDELPLDPDNALWRAAPRAEIPMSPQIEIAPYWTAPSVDAVDVVAAVNKDELGIRLAWSDASRSTRNEETRAATVAAALARWGTWKLTDAVAVEFPNAIDPNGTLPPSLFGDEKRPVRRWYWSAERQESGDATALLQLVGGPRATPLANTDGGPIRTAASYVDGQWRVLMLAKRPAAKSSIPVAIQAWDGGAGETGTWMSTSAWVKLTLE